jgi:hypothetical protein
VVKERVGFLQHSRCIVTAMGELLSIREVIRQFDQNRLIYTVEPRPEKKPPQKAKPASTAVDAKQSSR